MSSLASLNFAHKPTFISHASVRFLIMDAPTDNNLPTYIEECKKHNVYTIVRACEPTYSTAPLAKAGISVMEMPFPDGDPPPQDVITKWLDLCDKEFSGNDQKSIAVHCVAGLGRAPALVAISLIENGLEALDAIELIRKKRRGAINARQLKFLELYKSRRKKSQACCLLL